MGDGVFSIVELMFRLGICRSRAHARCLVKLGAVKLGDEKVTDGDKLLSTWDARNQTLIVRKKPYALEGLI